MKGRKKLVKKLAAQLAMEFLELQRPARAPAKRTRKPKVQPAAVAAPPPSPARRQPIKISDTAIAMSKQRRQRFPRVDPFKLPTFPVAVMDYIPVDRRMAADEAISSAAAWAGGAWSALGQTAAFEGVTFLGYPYLAELAQRPEYRVIVETIATEATRKWIRIEAKGDADKSKKIAQLNDELERLKVRECFGEICEKDGYFGRAHLYIDTGNTDDREELLTPIGDGVNKISKEKLGKGAIKRLAVVEPIWCYPSSYNTNNPLKPDWYNPQRWFAMQSEVHSSRLLRFVGREVPDILKPAYAFGGLSLTQMAKPYVENWLNTRQSVADIIQAFSVMVLGTNLGETLTPAGDELFKRADLFNNLRDNRGLMIVDKESEEFSNVSAPLGTLDALQAQSQEHMAAVSRIPLVKLLGISPHGLNATAEPELRAFYDTIAAFQGKFFGPNLKRIFAMAQLNIWGKVDPDLSFAFIPLWSMTEKEESEIRKTDAETGQIHIDSGVISPEEERARIAGDPSTRYPGIDPDDVPDLEQEEEEGLEPGKSAAKSDDREGAADEGVIPFDDDETVAQDADFKEGDHPRDKDGKFASGGSSGSTAHLKPAKKAWVTMYAKQHAEALAAGDKAKAEKIKAKLDKLLATEPAAKAEATPAPPPPPPPPPKYPPATPAELEKAKKNVKLQLSYVPNAPQTSEAQKLVDDFNTKYAGKNLTTKEELQKKVDDFKDLQAEMIPLMSKEQKAKAEAAAKAKAEAEKKAKEDAAKAAIEAQRAAEKNKKVMAELGINEQQAGAVVEVAKMLGSKTGDVVDEFKKYEKEVQSLGYPITGFQAALIKNYSGSGYIPINEALRRGHWSPAQHVYVALTNRAIMSMPKYKGTGLSRGTSLTAAQQASYVEGSIVQEDAFMSTSTGAGYDGNTKFKVTGIGRRGANIRKLSRYPHEEEVLFAARTYFKVNKVEGTPGGNMTIHLEEWEEHL